MPVLRPYKANRKRACAIVLTGCLSFWSGFFLPSTTETAVANGDTRTIRLFHAHRRDSIEATYRVNGHYDTAVLEQLNYFLRDWRNDDQTNMDPRLFDVVWEVYRSAGATDQITVLSAYRSPETNAMLRRRSRAVAEHSQHMLGKAMDTTMPDMSMEKLREIGMKMQRGGVGYYPSANFVHLDVGSVRHWPRMSYDQLSRLFPDGKTVHIPSNGQPLPGYEEARAEIEANGGMAAEQPKSKGFFAWLFGGSSNEDDAEEVASAVSSRESAPAPGRSRRGAAPAPVATASFVASASQAQPEKAAAPDQTANAAPAPANQRVASLSPTPPRKPADADDAATAATDDTSVYGSVLPIPPRRPSELMALANVPLPPSRPAAPITFASLSTTDDATASLPAQTGKTAAAKPDAVAALISATGANTPDARTGHPQLPAVITQGTNAGKTAPAANVLAYAPLPPAAPESVPTPPTSGLRSATLGKNGIPIPPLRGTLNSQRASTISARLNGSNFRSLTADASATQTPTQSAFGSSLYGLRAASRGEPGTLSNGLSANYVTRFAAKATDLDTAHFSGKAVQPPPSAAEALKQVASFK